MNVKREETGSATLVAELHALRTEVAHVEGSVVASTDGMLIAFDLVAAETYLVEPAALAALAAVNLGLSRRIADTSSHGDLHQSVISSTFGTVATYPAGEVALLSVLSKPGADLESLNRAARAALPRVTRLVEEAPPATPLL